MLHPKLFLFILIIPILSLGNDKLVIDLKVPLLETSNLAPAQAGATVYLMKSDWAIVSEVKEDVAVWLTDYTRHKNLLRQQVISITLEVREPAILRTGNLIKQEKITVRYWPDGSKSEKFKQQFLNDMEDLSQELKVEAYHLGLKIESELRVLLK